jgi:hypothetical protein
MTTETTAETTTGARLRLADLLEGPTAAQLVVAADDLGWWARLLNGAGSVVPATRLQRSLARALERIGWLAPAADGSFRLTPDGVEIAFNRGFVRVAVRGWEPTFRVLGERAAADDVIPARTDPAAVARGCTDIARRSPATIAAIAARIAADPVPGTTLDLGCADGGRLQAIGALAPDERLAGVDIEAGVIAAARARLASGDLAGRFRLLAGSVQPGDGPPPWLDDELRENVTTAMTFFLLHQLASDGGGIAAVLGAWTDWFPNLRRLVVGDVMLSSGEGWHEQPWFAPTFEIYHELTGVRIWRDEEYRAAYTSLGWRVAERHDGDHPIVVTSVLER